MVNWISSFFSHLLAKKKWFKLQVCQPCGSILISCSWHQTTKQPILFPPIFSTNFSPVLAPEKGSKLFIGPKHVILSFGPMKSLFSFSIAQTKKNSWKKLGKTRLVAWWFDVTNKIYKTENIPKCLHLSRQAMEWNSFWRWILEFSNFYATKCFKNVEKSGWM